MSTQAVVPVLRRNHAIADRRFYLGMALACVAVIVTGFSRTYYLKSRFPLSPPTRPSRSYPRLRLHPVAGVLRAPDRSHRRPQTEAASQPRYPRRGHRLRHDRPRPRRFRYRHAPRPRRRPGRTPKPSCSSVSSIWLSLPASSSPAGSGRRDREAHQRLMLLAVIIGLTGPGLGRLQSIGISIPGHLGLELGALLRRPRLRFHHPPAAFIVSTSSESPSRLPPSRRCASLSDTLPGGIMPPTSSPAHELYHQPMIQIPLTPDQFAATARQLEEKQGITLDGPEGKITKMGVTAGLQICRRSAQRHHPRKNPSSSPPTTAKSSFEASSTPRPEVCSPRQCEAPANEPRVTEPDILDCRGLFRTTRPYVPCSGSDSQSCYYGVAALAVLPAALYDRPRWRHVAIPATIVAPALPLRLAR